MIRHIPRRVWTACALLEDSANDSNVSCSSSFGCGNNTALGFVFDLGSDFRGCAGAHASNANGAAPATTFRRRAEGRKGSANSAREELGDSSRLIDGREVTEVYGYCWNVAHPR